EFQLAGRWRIAGGASDSVLLLVSSSSTTVADVTLIAHGRRNTPPRLGARPRGDAGLRGDLHAPDVARSQHQQQDQGHLSRGRFAHGCSPVKSVATWPGRGARRTVGPAKRTLSTAFGGTSSTARPSALPSRRATTRWPRAIRWLAISSSRRKRSRSDPRC